MTEELSRFCYHACNVLSVGYAFAYLLSAYVFWGNDSNVAFAGCMVSAIIFAGLRFVAWCNK